MVGQPARGARDDVQAFANASLLRFLLFTAHDDAGNEPVERSHQVGQHVMNLHRQLACRHHHQRMRPLLSRNSLGPVREILYRRHQVGQRFARAGARAQEDISALQDGGHGTLLNVRHIGGTKLVVQILDKCREQTKRLLVKTVDRKR